MLKELFIVEERIELALVGFWIDTVWAPDGGGPQIELQIDAVSLEEQPMVAA